MTTEGDVSVSKIEREIGKESEGVTKEDLTLVLPSKDQESKESKHQRMRIKVLEEIVTTEKAYVHDLNFILKNFVAPLRKLISEEDSTVIFSNVATIHSVHQTIYASLSERVWGSPSTPHTPLSASTSSNHDEEKKEGEPTSAAPSPRKPMPHHDLKVETDFLIADIFVKNADYLKFYTTYTLNQSESLQAIRRLKQNSVTFNAFLKGMQNRKTDIGSYLIKPVQRICKYPLLLRELLKYTPNSHPDYDNLSQALEKVQAVATHVDVHNQRVQNVAKMMEIQRALVLGKNKFDVVKPSRVFVQEADLISMKPGTQKGKTVRVFLFNDVLVIADKGKEHKGETKLDETGQPLAAVTYNFQMRFSLKLLRITELDKPGMENAFELLQPMIPGTGKKARGSLKGSSNIILQASSMVEKQKWVLAINQCKKELQAKLMAKVQATNDSKKGRAATLQLFSTKDDDSTNDEDSASSEASYSPRESPRISRASHLESIDESSPLAKSVDFSKQHQHQQQGSLLVPQSSRSLPNSPAVGGPRRRSASYSQLAINPQVLAKEREKEKEEREKKEKKKEKKEKKEKKKKRGSQLLEDTQGEGGNGSKRKSSTSRKELFQEDDEGSDDEKDDNNNKKKDSAKTRHLKDRARSRSFTQLPAINKIDIRTSDGVSTPTSPIMESAKLRVVGFKRNPSTESTKLPTVPTRRKSISIDDEDEDEGGGGEDKDNNNREHLVASLRLQLAQEKLKKAKWKDRYSTLKAKYDELESTLQEERKKFNNNNHNNLNNSNNSSEGGEGGNVNEMTETMISKALTGLLSMEGSAALAVDTTGMQEGEIQALLAQRKNELEEKKRILESKRKELEEKRRESGLDN